MVELAALLAQTTGSDPNPLYTFFNFGVLGALVVALVARQLRTAGDVKDAEARAAAERTRAEAAEARERALYETLRNEVVPAMVRFTDIASRLLDREH